MYLKEHDMSVIDENDSSWLFDEADNVAEAPTHGPGSTDVRITFVGPVGAVLADMRDFLQARRRARPRLTPAQCNAIRRRAAKGESNESLGAAYGVSREKIRKVLKEGKSPRKE
jgi:hypothetical protein